MDESMFLKGYITVAIVTITAAGAILLTGHWWVDVLAFFAVGITCNGLFKHYAGRILKEWEETEPGAYAAHFQQLPPWFDRHGKRLMTDRTYPYSRQARETIDEYRFFEKIAAAAVLLIWILLIVCDVFGI